MSEAWPDDKTETLIDLYKRNQSSSSIARILETSRNAVIGKLHRLGYLKKSKTPYVSKIKTLQKNINRSAPAPRRIPKMDFVESPDKKPLDDLKKSECHFPYGDETPYQFCGQAAQNGSSYCPYHSKLTSTKARSRL